MDADLFDHLTTTITNGPSSYQQLPPSTAGDDGAADTVANNPSASAPASPGGSLRRQRTMSSSLPEEIDQVVQVISSSQWAARLGGLMGSVKRQVACEMHRMFSSR